MSWILRLTLLGLCSCATHPVPPYPSGAGLTVVHVPPVSDDFEAKLRRRVATVAPVSMHAWLPADAVIVGLLGRELTVPRREVSQMVRVIDAVETSRLTQLDCEGRRYSFDFFVATRALPKVANRRVRMTPAADEEIDDAYAELTPGIVVEPRAGLFRVGLRISDEVVGSVEGRVPDDAVGRFFWRLESASTTHGYFGGRLFFSGGVVRSAPGGPRFARLPRGGVDLSAQHGDWSLIVATYVGVTVRGWVPTRTVAPRFGYGAGGFYGRGSSYARGPSHPVTLAAGTPLFDPEHLEQRLGRTRTTTSARCIDACTTYRPRVRVPSCLGLVEAIVHRRRRGPPLMRLNESLRSSSRR